jgi:HlyD family secretion protein
LSLPASFSRLIFFGLAATLAALIFTGCARKTPPAEGTAADAKADKADALPVVQTVPVKVGEVTQTVRVTGVLAPLPNHEAKISPPFAGKLAALSVQLNQTIRQGEVVAQMSTQPLLGQQQQAEATIAVNQTQVQQAKINALQQAAATRSAIAQAQATLAGSQATLANAKQNYERQQRLYTDGLVAQKDVDDALTMTKTAQATVQAQKEAVSAAQSGTLTDLAKRQDIAIARRQVENARGALTTARAQIALATLRSPLTGVVATVTANNGETLDTTAIIATIVDTRDLQLTIAVPSRSLPLVHRGQVVQFTTESLPGKTFSGEIASIGAQVDPQTGTLPVQVHIHNTSRLLRDDMTAVGQIAVARHPHALLVPKTALLKDPVTGAATVVVVGADGIAHVHPITLGLPSGNDVEVIKGVQAGEAVGVSGQYGLPDGTKVSTAKADGTEGGTHGP